MSATCLSLPCWSVRSSPMRAIQCGTGGPESETLTVSNTDGRLYFEPRFLKSKGNLRPEERLPMSFLGAFCFPICLFWFGWTANRTSWVSPTIAASFFGIGATWMFVSLSLAVLPDQS